MTKWQSFNKYILTKKIRTIIAFYILATTGIFYFTKASIIIALALPLIIVLLINALIAQSTRNDEEKNRQFWSWWYYNK